MNYLVIFIVLVVFLSIVAVYRLVSGRKNDGYSFQKVKYFFSEFEKYRFFVRLPGDNDDSSAWRRIKRLVGDNIETDDGNCISCYSAEAILVVYPNGEIVTTTGNVFSLPDGCRFLTVNKRETDTLDMLQLEEGNRCLRISFAKSPVTDKEVVYYSTQITNISSEPVRIHRFGGYNNVKGKWILFNAAGAFYDSEQFHSWYGMQEGQEWIQPGESVCDPSNYGGIPLIWAYYFETQSGKEMVAGGLLEKYP